MSIKINRNLRDGSIRSLSRNEIEMLSKAGIKDNEETLDKLRQELKSTSSGAEQTSEKVTVLQQETQENGETIEALAKTIALTIKQVLPDADTTKSMQTDYFRDRSWFSDDDEFISYNFTTDTQCETSPQDIGYGAGDGKALDVPDLAITTTADYMFYQSGYSVFPDLNTPKLQSAGAMFYGCRNMKKIPEMDTGMLTSANYMFCGCTSITKTPKLNFASAPSASAMFYGCENLAEVKIYRFVENGLDESELYVTNPSYMFAKCTKLEVQDRAVYLSKSTTTTEAMFYGCASLRYIPIDCCTSNKNLVNMSKMFMGCTSITDFNDAYLHPYNLGDPDELLPDSMLTYWTGTSAVTDMSYIFADCVSLKATPVFDCSSCTNLTGAFRNCRSLGNIRMVNIKTDLDISDSHGFNGSTLYKLIQTGLAEVEETKTLTVNEDTYEMLYESDIEDANAKGWTIAVK